MSLLRRIVGMDHSYADFRRSVEIVDLLVKFGFADLAEGIHIHPFSFWKFRGCKRKKRCAETMTLPRTVRVRMLLEELGPTFVKLGQVLASRPDLIPLDYVKELSRLQDHVPGFPGEEARKIVEKEFGRPMEDVFRSFSPEPFAAASIGQVHKAVLKNGRAVVVKVQRPGIEQKIAVDLEIMHRLALRLERSDPEFAILRPGAIVEEFSHVLTREMNYMVEATHARRFAANMKDQEGIYVPEVFMEYTTAKVLTMERIVGISGKRLLEHEAYRQKFDLPLIAGNGAKALMAQIFRYGFFHADPHAGNLILLDNNVLCFIDFGMMGRVSEEERGYFIRAVKAIFEEDYMVLTRAVRMLSTGMGPNPDWIQLERDLADLVQENLYLPLEKLSLAHILEQLMKTMNDHKLSLRPDLFVMFKALMTIEHVAREFDPNLNVLDMLRDAMQHCRTRRLNLRKRLEEVNDGVKDWWALGSEFPAAARKILEKASDDSLAIRLEHHNLAPLEDTIRYSLGMLAISVLISSLLISSALIIHAGIPPKWHNIPLLGVAGFLLAGILGCVLLLRRQKRSLHLDD